jgi:hypothetical protein
MKIGTQETLLKKVDQLGGIECFVVGTGLDVCCVLVGVGLASRRECSRNCYLDFGRRIFFLNWRFR